MDKPTTAELISKASSVINFKQSSSSFSWGDVGCALLTKSGKVFVGVCIDSTCGMGFCAEHNAIGSMLTTGESLIQKIVAVWKDEKGVAHVIPPCGRCREFIRQVDKANMETEVILAEDKVVKLAELLPYPWGG